MIVVDIKDGKITVFREAFDGEQSRELAALISRNERRIDRAGRMAYGDRGWEAHTMFKGMM